ncbi:hypothetical protein [uncultured Leclercia sp.]|uniref:hypothetical protein n=1 Tax=uncultured Leclercia sp. TaxID=332959 RepID=UPI00259579A5|nr:hypothetical protein [uncultured Leclercia sp.]
MRMNSIAMMMVIGAAVALSACKSPEQRMAECASQGISKDTCYLVEQNRQQSYNEAAQNAAYANARDAAAGTGVWAKKDKHAKQHAQAAHKPGVKHWKGMKLEITKNGLVVDGKPAAVSETSEKATVYQQGLYSYVVYSNGKIGVLDDKGAFLDYAK